MNKGYQLLMLKQLDAYAKWPHQHVLLLPILHWLVSELNSELLEELDHAQFEIIWAQYVGAGYPTIGIHYFNEKNPQDIGPLVENTIEQLLSGKPIFAFINYTAKENIDWNRALVELMNKK